MELGNKLLKLRKARGMSQEDLAGELEVSRQAVSRWESGETLPDAVNLLKLSDLFGVSSDYLLRDELKTEQQMVETIPLQHVPVKQNSRQFWGKFLTIFSSTAFIILFLLSTIIESYAEGTYVRDGQIWQTYGEGFSFWGFIDKYHLYVLVFVLAIALIAGLCMWDVVYDTIAGMAESIKNNEDRK